MKKINDVHRTSSIRVCPEQVFRIFKLTCFLFLIAFQDVFGNPEPGSSAQQQQRVVTGVVTGDDREPMPGVTILVKGTQIGTITDINGKFSLSVPSGARTLVFSFIGMETQEIALGAGNVVNVRLSESRVALSEVVVVGYGVQQKESVVGSIVQTNNEDLRRAGGTTDLKQALTGRLPGVTTIVTTGEPGGIGTTGESATTIYIRGKNTWNGGQPLILVDGVERRMENLDVNEVESISVLKDASATAVFGVKGANGVILITTKRGSVGKTKLSVNYTGTAMMISKLPSSLDAYQTYLYKNEMIEREVVNNETAWGDYTPMAIVDRYKKPQTAENALIYPNVNWEDALFKDMGFSHRATVSAQGGTSFVNYFTSLSYLHEGDMFEEYNNNKGYEPNYNYDRFNFRSNLDFKLTKTTNLKVNLSGYHGIKNTNYSFPQTSQGTQQLVWLAAYGMPPNGHLVQFPDGRWGLSPLINVEVSPNPVAVINNLGICQDKTTQLNSDFALEQDLDFITEGLSARGSFFFDNTMYSQGGLNDLSNNIIQSGGNTPEKYVYQDLYTGPDQDPSEYTTNLPIAGVNQFDWVIRPWYLNSEQAGSVNRRVMYQFQMNYGRKFGVHNVGAMGLVKREEYANGSEFRHYREDWVFRGTYDYDSKYLFEVNGAYNGSEQFGPGYRFAFFPSLAVGWLISNEKFFKLDWMDRLKIRYSIGKVGDDYVSGGRWLYESQYQYGGPNAASNAAHLRANPTQYSPYIFYSESLVGNPNIHWEQALKQNYGLEMGLFKNMISVTTDYFMEDRTDILIAGSSIRNIPSFFGIAPPTANLGRVKAKGYEFEIKFEKKVRDFGYYAAFGITHTRNKIIERDDPELYPDYMKTAGFQIDQTKTQVRSGFYNNWDEIFASVPQQSNDLFKLPGYYNMIDFNGDGMITSAEDAIAFGFPERPENTYNMELGVSYKKLSLNLQFYGVNNVTRNIPLRDYWNSTDVLFSHVLDSWSKDNTDASSYLPRWKTTQGQFTGDYWRLDGSYLRLKTAELSYEMDHPWMKKIGLGGGRIYLNGENLFFWSKLPDDREAAYSGLGAADAYGSAAYGAYPTVKRINLGIDLTF